MAVGDQLGGRTQGAPLSSHSVFTMTVPEIHVRVVALVIGWTPGTSLPGRKLVPLEKTHFDELTHGQTADHGRKQSWKEPPASAASGTFRGICSVPTAELGFHANTACLSPNSSSPPHPCHSSVLPVSIPIQSTVPPAQTSSLCVVFNQGQYLKRGSPSGGSLLPET